MWNEKYFVDAKVRLLGIRSFRRILLICSIILFYIRVVCLFNSVVSLKRIDKRVITNLLYG